MALAAKQTKGIFCLEGDWWGVHDTTTVEPMLKLLETYSSTATPYIHRDVGTREEFEFYLAKWARKGMSKFPILYIGLHGAPGIVHIGEGRRGTKHVTLEEIAISLEARCRGRIVYFGSCSTLDVHGAVLNRFLTKTGALAVCGFRSDVEWLLATTFDVLLLGLLQHYSFTRQGIRAVEKELRRTASGLVKTLDFRLVISKR